MIHIALVTHSLGAGGAERVIVQLLNNFAKNKVKCTLIKLYDYPDYYEIDNSVEVYTIYCKSSKSKIIDRINRYWKLRKKVIGINPDVVLSIPEIVGIYVIASLIGTKFPVVVSERNNPWVIPHNRISRFLRPLLYSISSGVICQTNTAKSFFSKKIQNKCVVLPNPLDLQRIPDPHCGKRRKMVVGAGRLEEQKNFFLLIRAFEQFIQSYPDYKLVIYGEGNLRNEIEEYASKKLPNDSFHFPGNNSDLLNSIKDAEMFVLSSNYEGVPNVLIEAMALGMPVISTDCPPGGPAELIRNGENGYLVPVNDDLAMLNSMLKIVQNPECSTQMGNNATLVKEKYEAQAISGLWLQYLTGVSGVHSVEKR